MTTLAALADRIQTQLNDTSAVTWKQEAIEAFCLEAIRDYSTYFRRHAHEALEVTTAGQQEFELPDDFRDMILVEFPVSEDPPRYLKRRSRTHPNFWQQAGYYDYHRQPDERRRTLERLSADFPRLVEQMEPEALAVLLQHAGLIVWCEEGEVVEITLGEPDDYGQSHPKPDD